MILSTGRPAVINELVFHKVCDHIVLINAKSLGQTATNGESGRGH